MPRHRLSIILSKRLPNNRLSAVEWTGARSAGHSAACNDFNLTARVCNMTTWGGTWRVNLDVGGEIATTGRVARIWEEDDSVSA